MNLTLNALFAMALRTLRNPREGAAEVLSLGIPREAVWLIVGIVAVVSVILAELLGMILSPPGTTETELSSPVVAAAFQLAFMLAVAAAVQLIGRIMGGKGTFIESLLLVAWLNIILIFLQFLMLAAAPIFPTALVVLLLLLVFVFFWLLSNFVAVLHGFASVGHVFVVILMSLFILGIVLAMFGVTVPLENGGI